MLKILSSLGRGEGPSREAVGFSLSFLGVGKAAPCTAAHQHTLDGSG